MMAGKDHGRPCWFELMTPALAPARDFYSTVFDWQVSDAGMPDFTYLLAQAGDAMVAGMMDRTDPQMPGAWMVYLAVDDVDATAAAIARDGGAVHEAPDDIPGTGRFAIVADPQGAVFGLLTMLPMDPPPESGAFDRDRAGHGRWIDLRTPDPAAALAFYGRHFGWRKDGAMPMGEAGDYLLFARDGGPIGGIMPLMGAPAPAWQPYFGVVDVAATIARVKAGGGSLRHGPNEVPGPALVVQATDPQGIAFAFVGPKPG